MRTPQVLCLLVDGFEEIEVFTPVDLLRRADCEVVLASVAGQLEVKGRSNITVKADRLLSEISPLDTNRMPVFDMLFLPGGPGVAGLRKDGRAAQLAAAYAQAGAWVAAICAAPTILSDAGLLVNRRFTAHFSVHQEIPQALGSERVVISQNIITSRGAGTALEFGLTLVECLTGPQKRNEISKSIMI